MEKEPFSLLDKLTILVIAVVLAILFLALPSYAQAPAGPIVPQAQSDNGVPFDRLMAAREKLIRRYVIADRYAWAVSACGYEDSVNGNDFSWLTVYVYKDSLLPFAEDFTSRATKLDDGGPWVIDGVPVQFKEIERPKAGE